MLASKLEHLALEGKRWRDRRRGEVLRIWLDFVDEVLEVEIVRRWGLVGAVNGGGWHLCYWR